MSNRRQELARLRAEAQRLGDAIRKTFDSGPTQMAEELTLDLVKRIRDLPAEETRAEVEAFSGSERVRELVTMLWHTKRCGEGAGVDVSDALRSYKLAIKDAVQARPFLDGSFVPVDKWRSNPIGTGDFLVLDSDGKARKP